MHLAVKIPKRLLALSLSLSLLAAACSPFSSSKSTGSLGVALSNNNGRDWHLSNLAWEPTSSAKKKNKPKASPIASAYIYSLKYDNSGKIYASSQNRGFFVSADRGTSWQRLLDNFKTYDSAVDWSAPNHVYAVGQAEDEAQILQSNDSGKTWQVSYSDAGGRNTVRAISLAPEQSKVLIAGLHSGHLIRSLDAGQTWSLLQNFESPVLEIAWPSRDKLFILTRNKGLYQSTDSGLSVINLSKDLLDPNLASKIQNFSPGPSKPTDEAVQVAPIDRPTRHVSNFFRFAVGSDSSTLLLATDSGVFLSKDNGGVWQFLRLPLRNSAGNAVRAVALSAGVDGAIYAAVGNTLFISANKGLTWQISDIATNAAINYILLDPANAQNILAGLTVVEQ